MVDSPTPASPGHRHPRVLYVLRPLDGRVDRHQHRAVGSCRLGEFQLQPLSMEHVADGE